GGGEGISPSLERIKEVQGKLKETFQCKALGPVGYYLGLHVERDEVKGWLKLHQHKYLAAMGEKYGLEKGRSVKTPLPSGFQLHLDEEEGEVLEYELQRRFQSMVGSLMYASVNTRPDIAFSVSQLARVVSRPLQEHLDVAERLVRYCMATSRVGLQYSVHGQLKQKGVEEVSTKIGAPARRGHLYLSCFTDATWASDISDATSHGGYICCVGGSPVSWKSKKQGEIAHSSTESEYMALFHGVKEVVWMRRLLEELGQEQEGPAAPVLPVRAPPGPVAPALSAATEPPGPAAPPAPAARLQRRENHSRSSCGESGSRQDEAPGESPGTVPAGPAPSVSAPPSSAPPRVAPPGPAPPGVAPPDPAPPGVAPPDSAPLGSAPQVVVPSGSIPQGVAPTRSAPPESAPPGSAPAAAPESPATSTGSTASTWDTPEGAGP
ncbi:unnamed protein product, partial [Closterium sp. NIES-53]